MPATTTKISASKAAGMCPLSGDGSGGVIGVVGCGEDEVGFDWRGGLGFAKATPFGPVSIKTLQCGQAVRRMVSAPKTKIGRAHFGQL